MKISNVEVIAFRVPRRRPGRGGVVIESVAEQTLTVISTDEGAKGYYLGGYNHGDQEGMPPDDRQRLVNSARRFLMGQDPYDRERFWQLMYGPTMPEHILSMLDMALWDLQARVLGVPVHKLLGGARDRVKAYASTYPSVGRPEEYAVHALQCKEQGYRAYKIHPYYGMAQGQTEAAPQHRSWVEMDIAACRLIREAVGDDMVLMFDPYGTYHNYEEALWVGRAGKAQLLLVRASHARVSRRVVCAPGGATCRFRSSRPSNWAAVSIPRRIGSCAALRHARTDATAAASRR